MQKEGKIRILALGIIKNGDRVFISQGYDPLKQETFYRALGGGVEFGETSYQALQREFREEIQADLTNIKYLGCLENLFTFNGKPGHEIWQIYQCDFVDPKFYQIEKMAVNEEWEETAIWVKIEKLKSGELKLVPAQFIDYL